MKTEMVKVGCGLRLDIYQEIINNFNTFHILEIIVDHYLAAGWRTRNFFMDILGKIPFIMHGVGLSLGSAKFNNTEYLKQVCDAIKILNPIAYTEHLAFTNAGGIETAQLLPLPQTLSVANIIINNIKRIKSYLDVPFYLENISYYFGYTESNLDEVEFINHICYHAEVGLLLDIENLRINSINHHYDPYEFIRKLSPGIVKCIHMAGSSKHKNIMIDTHDRKITQDLFDLLEYVLTLQHPVCIILERDGRLNKFDEVIFDCKKIIETIKK